MEKTGETNPKMAQGQQEKYSLNERRGRDIPQRNQNYKKEPSANSRKRIINPDFHTR